MVLERSGVVLEGLGKSGRSFLALLDCVSRANAVARASGVRP